MSPMNRFCVLAFSFLLACQSQKRRPTLAETVTLQADLQHNNWWQRKAQLNRDVYPYQDTLPLNKSYKNREQEITSKTLTLLKKESKNQRLRNAKGFCADGTLTIRKELHKSYQKGLFQPAKSYSITGRFSNLKGSSQHDAVQDTRSLSIRVQGVKGIPLLDPNTKKDYTQNLVQAVFQDLVTENRRTQPFHNIQEYLSYLEAKSKGGKAMSSWLLQHPKSSLLMSHHASQGSRSLAGEVFWSTGALQLGNRAIKYHFRPRLKRPTLLATSGPNFLRQDLQSRLKTRPLIYDLLVQVQRDPLLQPIEDPSTPWESTETPFLKLATLNFPTQALDGSNSCSQLKFNPWNGIKAHRPLGSLMRLEKAIHREFQQKNPAISTKGSPNSDSAPKLF